MLAEILGVTVVIMVVFISIYANFIPTTAEYEARISYNEVVPQYDLFHLRKLYMNSIKKGHTFSGNYQVLVDSSGCKNITKNEDLTRCNSFVAEAGITDVILTTYQLTELKKNYTGVFKDYLDYLPEYKNGSGYDYEIFRLIMKKSDNTYATMPLLANVEPSSNSCFAFDLATGTILDYYDYEQNDRKQPICSKNLIIPSAIQGVPVTRIQKNAFSNKKLLSVTFPSSITTIGESAFAFNDIKELSIPNSVLEIGDSAFAHNKLTSLTLGNQITTIGNFAFVGDQYGNGNKLVSITIPSSVRTIGNHAFEYNELTSLVLKNGVTTIGERAFALNHLVGLNLPNSLTNLQNQAFYSNAISSITFGTGLQVIHNGVFSSNKLQTLTISDSITTIDANAFSSNELTHLSLGRNVTVIKSSAFAHNRLTSLALNDGLKNIGESVFQDNRLTTVVIPSSVMQLGTYSFFNNHLRSVTIYGKSSIADFDLYGTNVFGWDTSYNDDSIAWR